MKTSMDDGAGRMTTHARVRVIAGVLAVVLCAASMFCAHFAGTYGRWEDAGNGAEDESLAFEGFGRVARAALGNLAVGQGYGMYGGGDGGGGAGAEGEGWTVRTTVFMRAAKVLACASAACAVAAVSAAGEPEGATTMHGGGVAKATSPRSVATKPTAKFHRGDDNGAESPRSVGGSPRTPGSESGRRGGRSLEEVARAKELAKERKRQARAEQELIAKKEEEDRAEIAALVVQERAKREARRAKEEELARKMREEEEARVAEALAASLESLEEEKRKLREEQEQEREAAEKDTMHSTGSGSGSGSKPSSPRVANGGGKGGVAGGGGGGGGGGGEKKSSPPQKGPPAPPRSQGLTLRVIPTPRTSQAARAAPPSSAPLLKRPTVAAAAAPPPPPLPSGPPPLPSGPPPLPAGPPPAYARKAHPAPEPPMRPTFGAGVSGDVTMGAMQPLSPRSPSGGVVPPPGFESLAPATPPSHRADLSADWSHVDSTIASFLESTADAIEDDDPFIMAARSSNYDDIFSTRISDVDITPRLPTSSDNNNNNRAAATTTAGTKDGAQPPLPPTPHPEVLAAVLGDVI